MKVTSTTRLAWKAKIVERIPITSVAVQGAPRLLTLARNGLTGSGQARSRALAQNMRPNWRVIARVALKKAMMAPRMRIVLSVGPR